MTDNTKPEALDLADWLEAVGGGPSAKRCAALLREQHARIAELESELEAAGAGGVSGPLMGQPQAMPDLSALTERGAKAWTAADAQGLLEGFTAADMTTAEARGFRDGAASAMAWMTFTEEGDPDMVFLDRLDACQYCEDDDPPKPLYLAAPPTAQAQGVGNSGFDYKTAADFLNGKTVSDEAVRKFVAASRWAHDERASLSAMLLSVRGELASREAEIALLKKALLEAEAAPQQDAQEPAAVVVPCHTPSGKRVALYSAKQDLPIGTQLYTAPQPSPTTKPAPQPAPAPLSEMPYEKRKAIQEGEQLSASDAWFHARFNMLDTLDRRNVFRAGFDRGWNAALA